MKLPLLAAAGLTLLTGLVPAAPAAAQRERVVVRERTVVRHETRRQRPRQVCTVRYRHGERVRTCRTVYRRY